MFLAKSLSLSDISLPYNTQPKKTQNFYTDLCMYQSGKDNFEDGRIF